MPASASNDDFSSICVLVADASELARQSVKTAIADVLPGARIIEAVSGPEALAKLRSHNVDAVIIDLTLPTMSGTEVISEARRENIKPFLILTSAIVLPEWGMLATELHAYEFMKKPCMAEDFRTLLTNFARMRMPTRILIADAGDHTRAIVRKVVSASRFSLDVQETDNGGHALKLARNQPFDVVLMDSNLHGINGLEAACQMQARHPDMMVVSILPSKDSGLGQSLKHLGIKHCLHKPFFTRDVDLLLHTAYNLRRPYLMNAVIKAAATAIAS
ncbi:MAG: response regulator [Bosea sp. (in: a-proteobacteria)]